MVLMMKRMRRSQGWTKCSDMPLSSSSVSKSTLSILQSTHVSSIHIDLEVKSTCAESVNVTVIPSECCIFIEKNDIDCEVYTAAAKEFIYLVTFAVS